MTAGDVSDLGDGFTGGAIEQHVHHAAKVPIHAGTAVKVISQAVAVNRAGVQEEVHAVDDVQSTGAAGQVSDASGVVDIGAAPLSQDGGQGGGVVVISGRAADQDVAARA